MSIVPPASATLVWAFPTEFEEVRCFVWEHSPAGWSIAIMFGNETLAIEVAPTRWAMETGVDMVWRGLLESGLGKLAGDARTKTLAAMSRQGRGAAGESGAGSAAASTAESALEPSSGDSRPRQIPKAPRVPAELMRPWPRLMPLDAHAGRFEDRFCPHTPFRHQEPSFDVDSEPSEPSPRRRPH